jgi:hypothetical protein
MIIISQNGRMDLPYDRKCIGATNDGCIVATDEVCVTRDTFVHSVIAEYSTTEKALKAIKEMRHHYRAREEYYQFPKEEAI